MKKLLLVAILGCPLLWVSAQKSPVQLGLSFGANLSNIISSETSNNRMYDWRLRFFAGVSQQATIKSWLLIRTEINYEGLGTSYPVQLFNVYGDSVGMGRYQVNLHYAQVPVLCKFRFGKTFKGFAEVGPYFGLLAAAKEGIDREPSNLFNYPDLVSSDDYTRFDFGIKIGLGLEIPVYSDQAILIGARYSQGFIDISDATGRDWNGAFNLHIGYLFQL